MEWSDYIQEKCSENQPDEASNWIQTKWVQSEVSSLGGRVEVTSLTSGETHAKVRVLWGR